MGTVFFYWDELIKKVNKNRKIQIKHGYEHLTDDELLEIEEFVC